jgi:hypothetical protein
MRCGVRLVGWPCCGVESCGVKSLWRIFGGAMVLVVEMCGVELVRVVGMHGGKMIQVVEICGGEMIQLGTMSSVEMTQVVEMCDGEIIQVLEMTEVEHH